MVFRISCAEALARRGLFRRASEIYRFAAYNWNLNTRESEEAICRSNSLLNEAKSKRLERAKSHSGTDSFDSGDFSGFYVGCSSTISTMGTRY